jgi:hypothetical protein
MDEWQVYAFLALVTLSMMAPCLFTATTARKIQRPESGPGASAATCHGSGSNTFFEYTYMYVYLLVVESHTTSIHFTIQLVHVHSS